MSEGLVVGVVRVCLSGLWEVGMGCSEARWNPGVGLCCRRQHVPRQGSLLRRIHCLVEALGTQPKAYPSPVWFYCYSGLGPNLWVCPRQRQARLASRVEQQGAVVPWVVLTFRAGGDKRTSQKRQEKWEN